MASLRIAGAQTRQCTERVAPFVALPDILGPLDTNARHGRGDGAPFSLKLTALLRRRDFLKIEKISAGRLIPTG